jgi:hypothetical protein
MSKKNFTIIATAFVAVSLFSVGTSYARSSVGNAVDSYCASRGLTPYGGNCDLCHNDNTNYNHARSGDYDWFCPAPTVPTCTDNDGDTYAVQGGSCGPVDCNDNNRAVRPGATENCTDGFDNNCNSLIDRQDPAAVGCPTLCTDNDGDGYGNPGSAGCAYGSAQDCNDANSSIHPGGAEVCDGVDNDCDGLIDDNDPGVTGQSTWHPDNDNDGYGNGSISLQQCSQQSGFIVDSTDCDDNDGNIYPGGPSVRTANTTPVYYSTLQNAYNTAGEGDLIQCKAVLLTQELSFDLDKTVSIEGGFDCSFSTIEGNTVINGSILNSNGSVTLENFSLE